MPHNGPLASGIGDHREGDLSGLAQHDSGSTRQDAAEEPAEAGHARARLLALTFGALGIVYGDIGTSPLYALRESFSPSHGIAITPANVLGVLSLVFWALVLIIVVKYLTFVLRADNRGEGGTLALLALISPRERSRKGWMILLLGLFGASLLYGEGVITPAISVLSALEGLEVATPRLSGFVVPIAIVILLGLFLMQKHGTARVGAIFGPVMLLWFVSIAVLGLSNIVLYPKVLVAANPWYAIQFFMNNGVLALLLLGSVVLVITGAEALYADLGHFGRAPIRVGWFAFVFPALLLNYFGQGAYILTHQHIEHPFFDLVPRWALYPMVVLATLAAIIASQALISGSFSITRQAIQLGYFPRLVIVHTSAREEGQIYIPQVNTALMIACIALVIGFRTSSALAAAYGLAVVGTMTITTILFYNVARSRWHWSVTRAVTFAAFFLTIELAFLGANLVKFLHGAYLPLIIGTMVFAIMTTWKRGRSILSSIFERSALPVDLFVAEITKSPPYRVPGNAIFLTANPEGVPPVLLHHLKHNKTLHEKVILLSLITEEVPHVPETERVEVSDLGAELYRVYARYGFMETPDVQKLFLSVRPHGLHLKIAETTFYLGRETLIVTTRRGMAKWRKRVFAFMQRNAQPATAFFNIPPNRVVELGAQLEI